MRHIAPEGAKAIDWSAEAGLHYKELLECRRAKTALLEALETIEGYSGGLDADMVVVQRIAEAAIAKAKGE